MEALKMMIEIDFDHEEDFLKIKETLTRMGVSTTDGSKVLFPSVLILHKRGKYYLTHFKTMFILDGKTANISELDLVRFKSISHLIREWGLCRFVDSSLVEECKKSIQPKNFQDYLFF